MSAIRSLWDGKRTLRKPYSTSSIYEYARQQKGLTSVLCKFPVPHFEFPATGEEPRPGELHVRRAGLAPPGDCHKPRPTLCSSARSWRPSKLSPAPRWPEDLSNAFVGEQIEQAALNLHLAQAPA
jgi:hypothetical protein